MINVKNAVDNARRDFPDCMLIRCVELDNGVLFFVKEKNYSQGVVYGPIGLYSSTTSPEAKMVPMGFLVEHSKGNLKELDISRFQTPEERVEASK